MRSPGCDVGQPRSDHRDEVEVDKEDVATTPRSERRLATKEVDEGVATSVVATQAAWEPDLQHLARQTGELPDLSAGELEAAGTRRKPKGKV